jgi:hypothetical protein
MNDSKWGREDLDDDIPLDPENVSEWHGAVSLVYDTFEKCGHLADTYDVAGERFDPYSVDVTILKLGEFSPDKTWGLAVKIKRGLRNFKHYWRVRIGIIGEGGEIPIWVEIDKYEIYTYRGKLIIERFGHMSEFYQKYWGTDFD